MFTPGWNCLHFVEQEHNNNANANISLEESFRCCIDPPMVETRSASNTVGGSSGIDADSSSSSSNSSATWNASSSSRDNQPSSGSRNVPQSLDQQTTTGHSRWSDTFRKPFPSDSTTIAGMPIDLSFLAEANTFVPGIVDAETEGQWAQIVNESIK